MSTKVQNWWTKIFKLRILYFSSKVIVWTWLSNFGKWAVEFFRFQLSTKRIFYTTILWLFNYFSLSLSCLSLSLFLLSFHYYFFSISNFNLLSRYCDSVELTFFYIPTYLIWKFVSIWLISCLKPYLIVGFHSSRYH